MSRLKAYIKAAHAWGWTVSPEFKTMIVEKANGWERRNADWANARHRFTIAFKHLSKAEYATLKSHHLVCRGMLHTFLHQDGMDDAANDEVFAVAEAGQQTFQLSKWSVLDGVEYQRKVFALYAPDPDVPGAALDAPITVTVDGTPTTAFDIDRDRGLITFDSPMTGGEVLRWTGPFSLWVRFDSDGMPMSYDAPEGIYGTGAIGLVEDRPPVVTGSPD